MKKSIKSKIIISYIAIVCISLGFVAVFFTIGAKNAADRQARSILAEDAKTISEIFKQELTNGSTTTNNNIKQLIQGKLKTLAAMKGEFAVITKNMRVIYPKMGEEAARFTSEVFPQVKNKLSNIKKGSALKQRTFQITINKENYMTVVYPFNSNGWVMLYTPVFPVEKLVQGMERMLFISLLGIGTIAILFGIFFARSIAKPIIVLKNRAQSLSKRDFDSRVEIHTGDELEELAHQINRMASELKEYDIAQKKFLQNASHELKTPLMSIQGYAEGIKDGVFENNDQALEIISEESMRLKSIVEELIFLSKLETMEDYYKFQTESVNDIIEKSIEKLNSLAVKSDIRINKMLYKDACISVDRDKITQALINIIGNCLRYARSEVNITTTNDGRWFEIKVNDDGEGFNEQEMKNVFERFYKGRKGNTGLGMAITKVIIEKHKGWVTAQNGPNHGAEFTVRLLIQ